MKKINPVKVFKFSMPHIEGDYKEGILLVPKENASYSIFSIEIVINYNILILQKDEIVLKLEEGRKIQPRKKKYVITKEDVTNNLIDMIVEARAEATKQVGIKWNAELQFNPLDLERIDDFFQEQL